MGETEHPQHIVSAMGVFVTDEDLTLLVNSPKRGWEPPGGQVEVHEPITDALVREIEEETNIHAEVNGLTSIHKRVNAEHEIVEFTFRVDVVSGSIDESPESPEVGWYDYDKALKMITHPSQEQKLISAFEADEETVEFMTYTLNHFDIRHKEQVPTFQAPV